MALIIHVDGENNWSELFFQSGILQVIDVGCFVCSDGVKETDLKNGKGISKGISP